MNAELERRASLCDRLEAYFRDRPSVWISIAELADVAGVGAWRSRLVELRTKRQMAITWNRQNGAASAYRYEPNPLGARDAAVFVPGNPETGTLFDLHPSGWQR